MCNKLSEFEDEIVRGYDCPDIILLTETWLVEAVPSSLLSFNFYEVFRKDRPTVGGGVAILIKKGIQVRELNYDYLGDLEILCLQVTINHDRFNLVCWYRPNVLQTDCLPVLKKLLNDLCMTDLPCVFAGDLNLPDINWETPFAPNTHCQKTFLEYFLQFSFDQYVHEPTRGNNILDIILCNEPNLISSARVNVPFSTSDHCVVSFHLNIASIDVCDKPGLKFCWNAADFETIGRELEALNWNDLFNCLSASDAYALFVNICNDLFLRYVPRVPIRSHLKNNKKPNNLKKLLLKKHNLYKKYKVNRTPDAASKYKLACKEYSNAVNLYHLSIETNVLNSGDVKKFFSYVNGKLKYKPSVCSLSNPGGDTLANDDIDKAEFLNAQFSSVFIVDDGTTPDLSSIYSVPYHMSNENFILSRTHVINSIKKLKNGSSPGPDNLPACFLINCASQVSVPLHKIFNMSLRTSIVPALWKQATVVPVYKGKGPRHIPANYRPISLTCIPCKVFERIINDRIMSHLKLNNLLFQGQHGFLDGKSTATQLLECVNDWTMSLNDRCPVDIVYLDISKAFDSVSHPKLIHKLRLMGVDDVTLLWVTDFLSDRTQRVRVGKSMSDPVSVLSGVPQGSVLGPILFLCFINDMCAVVNNATLKIFADDSKLYMKCRSMSDSQLLCDDVERVFDWATTNQLQIATQKCSVLHLGTTNPKNNVSVNGIEIPSCDLARDLGVNVDCGLKFREHCLDVCKKAFTRSNLIFKAFKTRNADFLVSMFKVYVRPLVEYCSCVWSPRYLEDIKLVEKVQRRYTKRIPGMSHLSYRERLSRLSLETLEARRIKFDLLQAYKIYYQIDRLNFDDFFSHPQNVISTRGHDRKLLLPHSRIDARRYSFAVRSVNYWNSLTDEAAGAATYPRFKASLNRIDLSNFERLSHD